MNKAAQITSFTIASLLLVGIGAAIGGASSHSDQSRVASQEAQIHRLQASLTTARSQASSADGRVETAQAAAASATTVADKKETALYSKREAAVEKLQRRLRREQGIVASSTISEDGVYVVGKDIPPGTYHTSGAPTGGSPGGECYFATLSSTNTSAIIDNNNFNGPETVNLAGAYALQISGGCTWSKD
jgi:multidrug efflux pump subunit AcrA (membrane-fusion protein)